MQATRLQAEERTGHPAGANVRTRILAALPVEERRLRLAGVETAVLEGGQGPPLVLLHGQGEFAATWGRVIPDLVRTHRVVAPDLPGHGASGLPDGTLDGERTLEWLGELIDRTCDQPPVVAGHLLGGAIAARFAAVHPDRVRRLVLVDTLGLAWYRPAPGFALAMIGFVAHPTPRSQDRLFRRCMADLDGLREAMDGGMELLEAYALERARTPNLKAALSKLMPKLGAPAIPQADLRRIAVPTSLIWGRDDLQVRLRTAEAASERYGWPLRVIDDARDDPAVEQPEVFLQALRADLGAAEPQLATSSSRRTS
jgi:pimeloyl-ACP methyl ester carboxylesterase